MNRQKHQHFVPILHLKYFAGDAPKGMIWTYDLRGSEPTAALSENTAKQGNFYSVKDDDGAYVDVLEHWLAGVESTAAPIYEDILTGKIPTGQDRADFAVFLSSSYARSPRLINEFAELSGKVSQIMTRFTAEDPEVFERMLQRMEAERGKIDPSVRANLRDYILDTSRYTVQVDRTRGLSAIEISDSIVEIIFDMKWSVFGTSQGRLISCDAPLVRFSPPETRTVFGDGGFLNKKSTLTYPLSPTRCLFLEWRASDRKGIIEAPTPIIRWYNHQRALSAWRFLYSSVRDDGIRRLGLKYRDRGPSFTTSFDDKVAGVTVKR